MRRLFLLASLMIVLFSSCKSQQPQPDFEDDQTGSPYPSSADDSYPAPDKVSNAQTQNSAVDHYVYEDFPAFQALPIALAKAQEWRKDAVLYQIPRLRQMEKNLSLPQGPLGWFFLFKDPGNPDLEYYVEVIDGSVSGATEVQQIIFGEPPYKFSPIDNSKPVLDSPDVLKIFFEDQGKKYIEGKGRVELELRLVFLEGMDNPVWSIFNPEQIEDPPLMNIDAVTGETTEDPFLPYTK
jgi:hypothetical protein